MSDEQFSKCHSYEYIELHKIRDDLENRGITQINKKLAYVKENYYGQLYMAYALEELNKVILCNYQEVGDKFILSKDAVDGILRAFGFAIEFLHADLPQHAHNYMISKSGSFFRELAKHYKEKNIE